MSPSIARILGLEPPGRNVRLLKIDLRTIVIRLRRLAAMNGSVGKYIV